MDAHHFDTLVRRLPLRLSRRSGLALLGALGSAGPVAPDPVAAKKKKKKRCPPCKRRKKGRCRGVRPDGAPCPGGGGFRCCGGVCTDELRAAGEACSLTEDDTCCSNYCGPVGPGQKACAATCRGKYCELEGECCPGFPCREVAGSPYRYCGGCQDLGELCETDADCCFSACTGFAGSQVKSCASFPGGRCATNADCRSCLQGLDCTATVDGAPREICHDGVCGCPDDYGCCSNLDCPQGAFCVFFADEDGPNGECRPIVPGP